MHPRRRVLGPYHSSKVREPQACISRQFGPQHRNGCGAPCSPGSIYLAVTQDCLPEGSLDRYIHAGGAVSHEFHRCMTRSSDPLGEKRHGNFDRPPHNPP